MKNLIFKGIKSIKERANERFALKNSLVLRDTNALQTQNALRDTNALQAQVLQSCQNALQVQNALQIKHGTRQGINKFKPSSNILERISLSLSLSR